VCAQLAAGFVTLRCTRSGEPAAAERFRARAFHAAVAVLLLMVLALVVAALSAPSLLHRRLGVALPAVVAGLATRRWGCLLWRAAATGSRTLPASRRRCSCYGAGSSPRPRASPARV
jgi:hypothetical protein